MLNYETREGTYGLEHGIYASFTQDSQTGKLSFGTPRAITGLRSVSVESSQEDTVFYADNVQHLTVAGAENLSGSFTTYQLPSQFWADNLGYYFDQNGARIRGSQRQNFALQFVERVVDENGKEYRQLKVYYNCRASQPSNESTTIEEGVEIKEFEVPLAISPSSFVVNQDGTGLSEVILRETDENREVFEAALNSIYVPVFTSGV